MTTAEDLNCDNDEPVSKAKKVDIVGRKIVIPDQLHDILKADDSEALSTIMKDSSIEEQTFSETNRTALHEAVIYRAVKCSEILIRRSTHSLKNR